MSFAYVCVNASATALHFCLLVTPVRLQLSPILSIHYFIICVSNRIHEFPDLQECDVIFVRFVWNTHGELRVCYNVTLHMQM